MGSPTLILLDTQIVIWLNRQQEKLSQAASEAIADARTNGIGLAIADITLWEIAMAFSKERIKLAVPLAKALEEVATLYNVLPISPKIAELSMQLFKTYNSDPADRLIAATALVHNIPLITSDTRIRQSNEVPCIW